MRSTSWLLRAGVVTALGFATLRIVHRFRTPGVLGCLPGEEVFAVFLLCRGHLYQLRLSLSGRLLVDYLARHRHCAQSAAQIEAGIRADEFYQKHAANAIWHLKMIRRIPRSAVKVHIARLRRAFTVAFREAGLRFNPDDVVVARQTMSNEVGYSLKAAVDWIHIDLAADES